jgi:DNA mismatch endonuclease Vsr
MSRIKGKGNKDTELAMIQILRKNHISGWRRNQAVLGKPDFVFPKRKIALFVDGCFWHGMSAAQAFQSSKEQSGILGEEVTGEQRQR